MKERWLEAVGKAFPEGHAPGFQGYPLLGSELSDSPPLPRPAWALRLTLREVFEPDTLAALLEDVQEVRLIGNAASMAASIESRELYAQEAGEKGWSLRSEVEASWGPLSGQRRVWARADVTRTEVSLVADGLVLRNLALLRALPGREPDTDRWLLRSAVSADGQTEGLIADTLAYWTGAVAGVEALEVEQQSEESFDTLWARLNICRLLRWEAELGHPGDAGAGSGLLHELSLALR